jgi:ribonuclease Z
MRFTKVVLTIYGLLFALLGIGFWAAPELLAQRFNIEALDVAGLSTLRADLGGLFLTLSGLTLGGVYARRRSLLIAAALMLSAAVIGRLIGWAATGSLTGLAATLPVEIGCVVAIVLHVRTVKLWPDESQPSGLGRVLLIGLAAVVLVAGLVAGALHTPRVQDALFTRFAEQNLSRDNTALMKDDALRVAICGSSAPLPSAKRAKACVAVIAEGKIWIVDSGPESTETLLTWSIPLDKVAGVLITHFHSDHIGDLGELNLQTWVQGRPSALAVYGGPGIEQVVAGFNAAYSQDRGYRTAHHTAALLPPATGMMVAYPVAMPATGQRTAVLFDDGKLKITAIETNHAPVHPAYAYRFDYKGRSVVVTGDTTEYAPLTTAARGADILVSEALNREMIRTMKAAAHDAKRPRIEHIMGDIQSYHIAPTEAADMANKAGVKLLVLYHLLPSPDNAMARQLFTRGLDGARHGDWDLADDGSLYTLPVGGSGFRIGRVPQ